MLYFRVVSVWVTTTLLCLHLGDCAEIVGGDVVKAHSLPHMALLENNKGKNVCGGTLIDLKWVLTAAHCADIKKVLLGVHSIDQGEKDSRQVRKVKKSFIHPCYNNIEKVNDLMLLKLDKPVKLTKFVKPLPPPRSLVDIQAGTKCVVAGWGATKNGNGMSNTLRSANVTVIDRVMCNSQQFYNFQPIITHRMLCAGFGDNKISDSCQGDSGGPLVCGGVFGGVTSFGIKCGIKTKPGVYTLMSNTLLDWIRTTIRK